MFFPPFPSTFTLSSRLSIYRAAVLFLLHYRLTFSLPSPVSHFESVILFLWPVLKYSIPSPQFPFPWAVTSFLALSPLAAINCRPYRHFFPLDYFLLTQHAALFCIHQGDSLFDSWV
ncbi:hypothetical protein BJV77DRAFT_643680 [Russula vinacea]|nr:hypothetical protein BJV77DRAFT_643680 [Russula vinacea]